MSPRTPRRPRRPTRAAGAAAAVLMATVLASCGDGDDTASGDLFATVDHQFGTTEIPSEPQRVLTLGLSDQDSVLALGVQPIAVSEWYGEYDFATWPWAVDELGDAEPVVLNGGVRDEENPPIDEIAELEPDLIISLYNGTTKEQYEQLTKIAPTVVPTEEFADFTITWQESLRVTGEALGREDQADEIIDGLEEQFAAAAAEHPEFAGLEVVVAERFEPGESVVRTGNDIRAKFFEDLGFSTPTEVAGSEPDEFGEIVVSDELIDALSRDLLVWNAGFDPEVRTEVEANTLYQTLPVVTSGHTLWIEDAEISGAFSWGTALSLEFALEQLVPQIAQTVAAGQ